MQQYGSFRNSAFCDFLGLALLVVAIPMVYWNEHFAVRTHSGLGEANASITEVSAVSISDENDGKIIHIAGRAHTQQTLHDSEFGIDYKGIRLQRHVEVYQWFESVHRDRTSSSSSSSSRFLRNRNHYQYERRWSTKLEDSSGFHDHDKRRNPRWMEVKPALQYAGDVRLGRFRLPRSLVTQIDASVPLPITKKKITRKLAKRATIRRNGRYTYAYIKGDGNRKDRLEVGDYRIWFTGTPPTSVSVVGKQNGETVSPYKTQSGSEILLLKNGIVDPAQILGSNDATQAGDIWAKRFVAACMMLIGCLFVLRPRKDKTDRARILKPLQYLNDFSSSVLVSSFCMLVVSGAAWIIDSPVIGIALFAVTIPLVYQLVKRSRANQIREAARQIEIEATNSKRTRRKRPKRRRRRFA